MRAELTIRGHYALFLRQWPSNWEPSPFFCGPKRWAYSCVEMYMMAEKAALFGDHEAVQHIMKAEHPAEMQRLGRKVKGFDETVWACERSGVSWLKMASSTCSRAASLAQAMTSTTSRVFMLLLGRVVGSINTSV